MNPRDLALVGFRIVAVYFGIQSIGYLSHLFQVVAGQPSPVSAVLLHAFVSLAPLAVAIVLWIVAPGLSKLAAAESVTDGDDSSLTARDLTRCGLIVVGIFVLVTTLPTLLTPLTALTDTERAVPLAYVLSLVLQCLLALAVVAGAGRITGVVIKLKRAGLSQ